MTIEELNNEQANLYLGGTVLVCLLSGFGIIGNIHVLLIYTFRMKQSNHRIFILCLAILDSIMCMIGMPFVIINFRKPYIFYDSAICKILTFYNFFICLASACVLVVISVDRYRKICLPIGKQMTHTVAKVTCLAALGVSLLFAWPSIILYDSTPIATQNPNITGYECNVRAEMQVTLYPVYFHAILLIVAVCSFIVLVVLYGLIGRVIWNHRTFKNKMDDINTESTNIKMTDIPGLQAEANFHSGSTDSDEPCNSKGETTTSTDKKPEENNSQDRIIRNRSESISVSKRRKRSSIQRSLSKFDKTKRTTIMLFWITVVFFISYVPYFVLRISSFIYTDWYPSMSYSAKVIYNTVLWCVFVNNMANSIIYGFCDRRFRKEVTKGYSVLFCRQ